MHKVQSVYNRICTYQTGESIIEVLVAMAIIFTILAGSLEIATPSLEFAQAGRQKLHAQQLLNEELESARAVRNQGWSDLNPGTYYPVFNPTGNPPSSYAGWSLTAGTYTTSDGYTESLTISIPYRHDPNTLLDTSSTDPQDPYMRKFVATVSWTSYGVNNSVSQSLYLSDWKPF